MGEVVWLVEREEVVWKRRWGGGSFQDGNNRATTIPNPSSTCLCADVIFYDVTYTVSRVLIGGLNTRLFTYFQSMSCWLVVRFMRVSILPNFEHPFLSFSKIVSGIEHKARDLYSPPSLFSRLLRHSLHSPLLPSLSLFHG